MIHPTRYSRPMSSRAVLISYWNYCEIASSMTSACSLFISLSVVRVCSSICHQVLFLSHCGHRSATGGGKCLYFIYHFSSVTTY